MWINTYRLLAGYSINKAACLGGEEKRHIYIYRIVGIQ